MATIFRTWFDKHYRRTWPARYEMLDGIRGLACLAVVLHHMGVVTIGHYAVMVFFVVSGYCITASTQAGLRKGLSFTELMTKRIRRIFPPYLLAVMFFAATRVAKSILDPQLQWHPTGMQWLQNLTLTQWLSLPFGHYAEASQNPTLFVASFWSLNYEEQFYLVMGIALLLAKRFSVNVSTGVLLLAVLGLVWNMTLPGGWISGLFLEYWVHFSLGSWLYFLLSEKTTTNAWRWFTFAMITLGSLSLAQVLPWQGETTFRTERAFVELAELSLVAVLLALLRPISAIVSRSVIWRPLAAIGTVSYSLYLVHQFNLHLVDSIVKRLLPMTAPAFLDVLLALMLHIGIGTAFWWVCERPFLGAPNRSPQLVTT